MADVLSLLESEIRWRIVHRGDTLQTVSQYLQERFPNHRGLSARNLRRFCHSRGIHYRSRLSDDGLDALVNHRGENIGHSYGRPSLHGLLQSEGICVAQS